jgi:hypothetical protein
MWGRRAWSGDRLGDDVDGRPVVEVSFTTTVTPAELRGHELAKSLVLDLARAADPNERQMILGELFVEVVPDTLLAGQVIIDLAGALIAVAHTAVARDGDADPGAAAELLARTFDAAHPAAGDA